MDLRLTHWKSRLPLYEPDINTYSDTTGWHAESNLNDFSSLLIENKVNKLRPLPVTCRTTEFEIGTSDIIIKCEFSNLSL